MEKQIAVVGHKPFEVPSDSAYLGIQVGNGPDIPSLIRDNTGDNISSKNASYCELTAQYWLWKNSTAGIKGLVHYRRILGSPNAHAVPFESIGTRRDKAVTGEEIESLLKSHNVIRINPIIMSQKQRWDTMNALTFQEKAFQLSENTW